MAKNEIMNVHLFGHEIGRIGLDENSKRSSFQYNPDFLELNTLQNIFPNTGIIKRVKYVQIYSQYNNDTFKSIPPQFADSLPDLFGSIVFKAWLEKNNKYDISVLEQLAYIGNRGMGALEYKPIHKIERHSDFNLEEIIDVLKEVLDLKKSTSQKRLDSQALYNIFKIGTSAGGARPKILVSEEIETGKIIPGDLEFSENFNHYIIKLAINEDENYPREIVEFCYSQIIRNLGIQMMDTKLIDNKHFATLRFDRQNGKKIHMLTASGITGWDYKSFIHSSYENLFKLAFFLKVPYNQIEELFKRMVFNVIFRNTDDHLKNHSFLYDEKTDAWNLSPAYDVTFALNPLLNLKNINRALSINGKRTNININDLLKIAEMFTVKNPRGIIKEVSAQKAVLYKLFSQYDIPKNVADQIKDKLISLD